MRRFLLAFFIAFFCVCSLMAVPPRPVPARFVADLANVFDDEEAVQELENYLCWVSDSTGVQVQIVTVPSLEGEAAFMYARNIGEEWGIGDANKNNGVVILIKPRDAEGGDVYIATGYGSECLLTDAMCSRIIDEFMMDDLREENYFAAAAAGAYVCAEVMMSGNDDLISANPSGRDESEDEWDTGSWIGLFAILLPFLIGLCAWFSPKRRARDGIKYARSQKELDKALLAADRCQLPEKDRAEALAAMRANMYSYIRSASTPEEQQQFIAQVAGMPLSEERIAEVVAGMKEYTFDAYLHCTSSSSLRSALNRAVAFGNDSAELKALFAGLLAALKVAEEKARREAAERRRARSSSHSSGRSYGGGHFGGGGAGRHF